VQTHRPSAKTLGIAILVSLAVVGSVSAWSVSAVRVYQTEAREYREAHSGAKIVGKTPREIVKLYGEPYHVSRGSNGKIDIIMYKDVKHGQYCCITVENELAVGVSFSGQ
jgi:hypothetical protein